VSGSYRAGASLRTAGRFRDAVRLAARRFVVPARFWWTVALRLTVLGRLLTLRVADFLLEAVMLLRLDFVADERSPGISRRMSANNEWTILHWRCIVFFMSSRQNQRGRLARAVIPVEQPETPFFRNTPAPVKVFFFTA
jgi:hypothetical protein